jgi:hypothetical protein
MPQYFDSLTLQFFASQHVLNELARDYFPQSTIVPPQSFDQEN